MSNHEGLQLAGDLRVVARLSLAMPCGADKATAQHVNVNQTSLRLRNTIRTPLRCGDSRTPEMLSRPVAFIATYDAAQRTKNCRQEVGFGRHIRRGPRVVVGAPSLCVVGVVFGGVLLSHTLAGAVPSALEGLASGFGMGPGVSPPLWPP
jgi:hypothetical protein